MAFQYLKAVHIIFIVTWFAGLFYLPRIYIYIVEAHTKTEPEKSIILKQLKMMATRLWYIITWPSAIITFCLGVSMLAVQPHWLQLSFMHIKLTLVVLLFLYHYSLQILFKQLMNDVVKYTSQQLRIWNEVSTLLLISIVFLIVIKSALSIAWGLAGLIVLMVVLMMGIKIYKKYRRDA